MLDLAGAARADPRRAGAGARRVAGGAAGRRRGRHPAAQAAPRRRAAAATGTDGPRAGRRRQPRPAGAAAPRRPRPRAGARRAARRSPRSPTRSGTRSGTPASASTTPCAPSTEAVAVASTDVKAGLGLLDARLVAGDAELAARLRTATLASWRQAASQPAARSCGTSAATARRQLGELAFLLEPDLKEAYGGLREGQVLRAVAAAQLGRRARRRGRGGLRAPARRPRRAAPAHRPRRPTCSSARSSGPVADALGLADEDALLREVSLAGRRLAFVADETWRAGGGGPGPPAARPVPAGAPRAARRGRRPAGRRGRARPGRPTRPPTPACCCGPRPPRRAPTCLLSPYTLKVLAVHRPPLPEPWPAEVRWSFLRLLASGRSAVPVLEQLDQEGLLVAAAARVGPGALAAAAPPVAPVHRRPAPGRGGRGRGRADPRRRPARPAAGRRAAARHRQGLAGRPQRGRGADRRARSRPGWASPRPDVATSGRARAAPPAAARHRHPARHRRPGDHRPGRGDDRSDAAVLQLLHALAQADGAATSASAWSPWKAHLVAALVARVQAKLGTPDRREPEPVLHPTAPQATAPAARRRPAVR